MGYTMGLFINKWDSNMLGSGELERMRWLLGASLGARLVALTLNLHPT